MTNIPIHLLNSFVVFNESKNIVDASASLGITQPALSKQLKQIEGCFDEPIFILRGRKKVLTPFGRELHDKLKARIGDIQGVVQHARKLFSSQTQANIRIAGRRGILDRMSGKVKFDGCLHFLEASNEQTVKMLMTMNSDLGVAHSFPETHELIAMSLFKELFSLVIPKKFISRQPTYGKALFSQLLSHPCLAYKANDEIVKSVCYYTEAEMGQLKVARVTENYMSLAEMVSAKWGWAILPSYLNISEKQNWIIPIPEKIVPRRQFFLIYRPEFSSITWFKDLISEIQLCF